MRMPPIIRRILKQRLLLMMILSGICCIFILEYRQIEAYQEKHPHAKRSAPIVNKPAALDRLKMKRTNETVYSEAFLGKIRGMIEMTKNYSKVDPGIKLSDDVPKGIAKNVDQLVQHKTGGFYIEIGIGMDEEDDLLQWLERVMGWTGLVLEPSIHNYNFKISDRPHANVFKSCIMMGNKTWHHSRDPIVLKETHCFPLGAVIQAACNTKPNEPEPELLTINSEGKEVDILGYFPFKMVRVKVVVVALNGALVDTTDIHNIMHMRGYKGELISGNHSTGRTYIIFSRIAT